MPRLSHGHLGTTNDLRARVPVTGLQAVTAADEAVTTPTDLHDFDFLFPDLAENPAALLPESPDTVAALKVLGQAMGDPIPGVREDDSTIPAAYTYFGQFVDHDTTLEVQPADLPRSQSGDMGVLLADDMVPMALAEVRNALRNVRTATLDLDSLYGFPAPRDPANQAKMRIGNVTPPPPGAQPPLAAVVGKGLDNDLPREGRSDNPVFDRSAQIGDPRNDENTIISQLHVAFLKAHNALVDQGSSFEEAQRTLRQHYQHIVVHDFLKRICDPAIVDGVLTGGNQVFDPPAESFFLPVEFSVAAYRFGHSMVRAVYDFNTNFNTRPGGVPATLEFLFTFSALSGQLGFGDGTDTLPANWVIQWENILGPEDAPAMPARKLNTRLAGKPVPPPDLSTALFNLQTLVGQPEGGLAAFLSVRNLLRGYRLRLPTGQAVAAKLGLTALTPDELLAETPNPAQRAALQAGGFHERTPLWYYVLAEAGHAGGQHLGPVGSTLVAEVLIALVRRSSDSILQEPDWAPSLPSAVPGTFELADLLRFAGVMEEATRRYTVQPGDTLSGIALAQLGDADRWPEIFALNRPLLTDPDVIRPGQVLVLPPATPTGPPPGIHRVVAGDTLTRIARTRLGDASRASEIFELNRVVLTDPNMIRVGQVLVLPPVAGPQATLPRQQGVEGSSEQRTRR